VIGLAGAFAAARGLSRFLFGVSPADPLTLTAVSALLIAVALLATYIPSHRALHIDPVSALRTE
jgi:putative ABC transport system permease protein